MWDFGDSNTGTDSTTSHAYAAAGTYTVTLTVSDGTLSDTDTTTADVRSFFPAMVFSSGNGNSNIKLSSGKPQSCFQVQPVDGSYQNSDVDLSSITMTYGATSIHAIGSKTSVDGDKNLGITEIAACF
jgi:PKD repeat protein